MSANFIQNEDEFSPDLIGVELYQGDNQNLMRVIEEYPEEIEKEGAVANAAEGNNVEALKILIERGFSIRPVRDSEGDFWYSPIGDAAGNLAFEALELLIAAGADVNETAKGRALPPLARAIRNANHANLAQTCKMIKRLIELGADVNVSFYSIPGSRRFTPLSYVLESFPQKKICQELSRVLEANGARRDGRSFMSVFDRIPFLSSSRRVFSGCGTFPTKRLFRDKLPPENRLRGKLSFDRQEAGAVGTMVILGREYRFRWIPAGEFMMGSPEEEKERETNERLHHVAIEKGFWITETHITQVAYSEVMDDNPSTHKSQFLGGIISGKNDYPVESVTWFDAKAFCAELNALTEGLPIFFRLPTEAEWEYACRAGTTTPFFFGIEHNGTRDNIDGTAPYGTTVKGPCVGAPTPVRSYPPNPWGLYDLHGNVSEWCEDVYQPSALPVYFDPPQVDVDYREMDEDPDPSVERSVRGGCFYSDGRGARSALRNSMAAIDAFDDVGFRVVAVKRER